ALADPKFDNPGDAWNNLGITYGSKGEYDKAIKAYRKALADPKYGMLGRALSNLSMAYHKMAKNEEARKVLKEALQKSEKGSGDYARAQRLLFLLEANLKPEAMSSDDRSSLERPAITVKEGPEQRLLAKIEGKQESEYDKYLEKEDSGRDDILSILRGWSSAVTLLEGSKQLWRGGGYFIKWRGKGIVIDPGFDFLRNFHDADYHGREIDAVLVSHNHTDHNADVRAIDDLRYELYKRRNKNPHGEIEPYLLMWDKDSEKKIKLQVEQPEHRFHPITFEVGLCEPTHTFRRQHGLPFGVKYFPVQHNKGIIEDPVAFKVMFKDGRKNALTIGFTGDTEYFDELGKYLSGCDILIGHISQPDKVEFTDTKKHKKNHLGYNGLVELIKVAKPKLTLVGEFWAGIGDVRIDLVQCLRERTGRKEILPAGIGLNVLLPSLDYACTNCKKAVPFANVHVGPPTQQFGNLSYLCRHCYLD
ncbi:MAG: tetratricopeptide repeat protein, partial [Desulfobacteraceae bacterium]|nr:tetratricopeptide repeat protein [Desulfobacteraceae bacterium]